MKKYYLLGSNVSHSLSPYIHNYIFKKYGIHAEYKIQNIKNINELLEFLIKIKVHEIDGINITAPYKIDIMSYLDYMDQHSKKIQAINCISLGKNSSIMGCNTDWYGFKQMIINHQTNIADKKIKIIGYGGAARAVEYALRILGISNINIYTRRKINHNKNIVYNKPTEIFESQNEAKNIIINSTPFHFMQYDDSIFDTFLLSNTFWIDLIYTDLSIDKKNKINKKNYINGLEMLIYQALGSIDIWFRKDISKDVDLNDLKTHLKENINVK